MSNQTVYNENIKPAVAGMKADETPATMISLNVEAAGGLAFGIAVSRGTDDYGCKAMGAGAVANDFIGFSVRERSIGDGNDKFVQYDSARIMNKGAIWVVAGGAVVKGNPVFIVPATGKLDDANITAGTNVQLRNAYWETSAAADGDLAIVRMY